MTDNRQTPIHDYFARNKDLEHRMLFVAANVIRKLENSPNISLRIKDQLTRSSSSIGANYAEACNSGSKLDFRNKIYTAKKETAETRFWLDLCIELTKDNSWDELRQESSELLMILQAIVNSLNERSAK